MEANSSPIYPPPTMTSRRGSDVSSIIDVLVYTKGLPLIPSIGGITVSAPVLIMMLSDLSRMSSLVVCTDTVSGETKEPVPV